MKQSIVRGFFGKRLNLSWVFGFSFTARILASTQPGQIALDPRLEIKLWATEPQVLDPVALCWDEQGVAYVAECRDYPYGAGPNGQTGSAIRRLADTDGDGRADQSTVFADGLSYVTSVSPSRGGLLVVAPPDILFLRDTTQDGVADEREVILTGLNRGISDSLANGLRYGLDNRFHVANGGSSGAVTSPRSPAVVTRLGDHDFSFRSDRGDVVLTGATGGGFGLVFDDFGRAFTPYNISHILHRILPLHVAERFPGFPPVALTASVSDHEEMSRIFSLSPAQTRPNHPEQAGYFSAAGGMGYLGSTAFPEDLYGSVLVGDAVGNLIHRDVLQPDGPVFRASRPPNELDREFLASRDPAFRPVAFEVGPDGALYVLDMQRDVIEHPDYIPEKMRKTLDLRAGENRGRIYRITPKGGFPAISPGPRLTSVVGQVAGLASGNIWQRMTAQRLLVEGGDRSVTSEVRSVVRESTNAVGRVQALWTLQGLGALTEADLVLALRDANLGVRENALRLAEIHRPATPGLEEAVRARAGDDSARVRFVAAQTLGAWRTPAAADALERILDQDYPYRWSRLAVLASLPPEHTRRLVARFLGRQSLAASADAARGDTCHDLADLLGARAGIHPGDVSWLIESLGPTLSPLTRTALLGGLADGLERSGSRPGLTTAATDRLNQMAHSADPEEMRGLWRVTRALQLPENPAQLEALNRSLQTAADSQKSLEQRVAAIRLVALGSPGVVTNRLLALLDAREPVELQQAALAGLRDVRDPALGGALLSRWRSLSPVVRPALLGVLLERRAFHDSLLAALEEGYLQIGELNLDLEQRRRLLRGGTKDIQLRAAKFMADEEYSNRKSLVTEWLEKLPATGEAARGRLVFEEACAQCHASGAVGYRVGPDLTGVAHRSVEDLLSNILDPNMAINPGFVTVTVETRDGEAQTGLLEVESPAAVTLLQAEGKRTVIARGHITRLESSGQSLMPEGLEAGRTPQQLRDLIAFLQQSR